MDFLVSSAWAQDAATATAPAGIAMLMSYLPILLIFAVFYFVVMRPQNAAAKAHAALLSALKKGDRVMTESGIMGTVESVQGGFARVSIADGVTVSMAVIKINRVLSADEAAVLDGKAPAKAEAKAAAKKK